MIFPSVGIPDKQIKHGIFKKKSKSDHFCLNQDLDNDNINNGTSVHGQASY